MTLVRLRRVATLFACLGFLSCTNTYLGRYLLWNALDTQDYQHYPARPIGGAETRFLFRESAEARERFVRRCPTVTYRLKGETVTAELEQFLEDSGTQAFLVVQDDTLLYEGYFNGHRRDSICPSFSVAKSFASALVGIAVAEGCIESVDDPITRYLPEMEDPRLARVSIRHLLAMSSGFRSRLTVYPWSEEPRSYFSPNLRQLALRPRIVEAPGLHMRYCSLHTQLLGMILERTTGRPVSVYLEERIWRPLGMEYPASWSLDSARSGLELMATGLNARAVDYARFGRLYLHGGEWKGKQIVPEEWVRLSTSEDPMAREAPDYHLTNYAGVWPAWQEFLGSGEGFYGWHWWGYRREDGPDDYFAEGALGQLIYVSPLRDLVIVRTGAGEGGLEFFPAVLKQIADRL